MRLLRGSAGRVLDPRSQPVQPAFYARTGSVRGDLVTLLHPPYTAWHLSYVIYGAAIAPDLDVMRLGGTLAAFLLGTGVAAHALDEWHSRPLRTGFSDRTLLVAGALAIVAASAIAVAGMLVISPWAAAWAILGVALMLGYVLEWREALHSDLAFALAWGGFPVLVGYWAQAEALSAPALLVALAATLLSLAQRALSTPARRVRRTGGDVTAVFEQDSESERWPRERLLATWESPLKLICAAVLALAAGLLAMRI